MSTGWRTACHRTPEVGIRQPGDTDVLANREMKVVRTDPVARVLPMACQNWLNPGSRSTITRASEFRQEAVVGEMATDVDEYR